MKSTKKSHALIRGATPVESSQMIELGTTVKYLIT